MGEILMHTIPLHQYLEAAQKFHWATKEHYIRWFGKTGRHRRTETMLYHLVERNKLVARHYGRPLIYTVPRRKNDDKFEHGLACTEGLVRFWNSKKGEVIPEQKFKSRGYRIVPEWGIKYDGKLLLYEFCTFDNFKRGKVKSKVTMYSNNLINIENNFNAEGLVIFVIDADRWTVDGWVQENMPVGYPFFFTDYGTFLKSPKGEQLIEPIYIWGEDGFPYPLEGENA